MIYNVFNAEEEANNAQEADFQAWKTSRQDICNCPEYWETTTAWGNVQQRLDGKWVYPVCPEGIQTHVQEAYNSNWFPEE